MSQMMGEVNRDLHKCCTGLSILLEILNISSSYKLVHLLWLTIGEEFYFIFSRSRSNVIMSLNCRHFLWQDLVGGSSRA